MLIPSLNTGGAEHVFANVANHLDRSQWDIELGIGHETGPYLDELNPDILRYELGQTRARLAVPPLVRLVRERRPDAVLSTLGFNLAASLGRRFFPRRTAWVAREGNAVSAFINDVARDRPSTAAAYRWVYGWAYRRADLVICQSEAMRDDLMGTFNVPEHKLRVIYNPVDLRIVLRPHTSRRGGGPRLLSIGKLHHQKGYDLLMQAFGEVRARFPTATLTILGEGAERPSLEALRDRLGLSECVSMPGVAADPYPELVDADLFVSSSRYEGLPNVVLEALVCGTAVVATDCPGGTREIVAHGRNGFLVRPEDPAALAAMICKGLERSSQLDLRSAAADAAARYGADAIAAQYSTQLERAVRNHSAGSV